MLEKYNKWRILGVFFDDPVPDGGGFQLRELSRKSKLAPKSVKRYLEELEAEGMIGEKKHRAQGFPIYFSNREGKSFLFYKKINTLILLSDSGIIEYLADACMPDTIVLFGSAAKGEDVKQSDIDLFVQSREKALNMEKFERRLDRKVNLIFSEKFADLSPELKNNVINGIKLQGYLKVF